MECFYCKKKIDVEHDNHYYCKCNKTNKVVCSTCYNHKHKCPMCKSTLKKRRDSFTKKAFYSPFNRRNLGF